MRTTPTQRGGPENCRTRQAKQCRALELKASALLFSFGATGWHHLDDSLAPLARGLRPILNDGHAEALGEECQRLQGLCGATALLRTCSRHLLQEVEKIGELGKLFP
mmetsp:Transcript_28090/g.78729  ORF Transcript_28090/g.78729 Transcript_28090/m.78729 type:complete len:107 (+) Transcript_28090:77-397(+)